VEIQARVLCTAASALLGRSAGQLTTVPAQDPRATARIAAHHQAPAMRARYRNGGLCREPVKSAIPCCYGGKVGRRLVHMLATQRPASATPRTINTVVSAMRSEYSISELPPQSRQSRANSFISCTG